jgi:hypothetical protein
LAIPVLSQAKDEQSCGAGRRGAAVGVFNGNRRVRIAPESLTRTLVSQRFAIDALRGPPIAGAFQHIEQIKRNGERPGLIAHVLFLRLRDDPERQLPMQRTSKGHGSLDDAGAE